MHIADIIHLDWLLQHQHLQLREQVHSGDLLLEYFSFLFFVLLYHVYQVLLLHFLIFSFLEHSSFLQEDFLLSDLQIFSIQLLTELQEASLFLLLQASIVLSIEMNLESLFFLHSSYLEEEKKMTMKTSFCQKKEHLKS